MRWSEIGDMRCSVARALSVVGDRWTLLVLRDAFRGTRRFDDFPASLGLSRPLLAERLDKLVAEGVLERSRYQERPQRFEYRLTDKGLDLYPVIATLLAWGDRWMAGEDGPPLRLHHHDHPVHASLRCDTCGEPVSARDVQARPTAP